MHIGIVLKALNSPIRRDIIARLRRGPMTAGELADAYDVSKPTMSTHFAALKDADLIDGEKNGVSILYSLNATVAEEAMAALLGLLGTGEDLAEPRAPQVATKTELES